MDAGLGNNQVMTTSSDNHRQNHRFCVAPMMDWTDRHDRAFLRQFTRHALLYSEMLSTGALLHGDAAGLLRYSAREQPLAIQLGGSVPGELAAAAELAQQVGYREVNLNVGCPSDRVQGGNFGACLMKEPALVAQCVAAMSAAVDIPVTVKCRIGVDGRDSEGELRDFVDQAARAGCATFIVHARIAILKGLTPKQNREIPPLHHDRVVRVKKAFPELEIVVNGGIETLDFAEKLLREVDGVMLGREAYGNPWLLHEVDQRFFGAPANERSRLDSLREFLPYVERELRNGTPLGHITRHMLGLFKGQRGGRHFRRHLSTHGNRREASIDVLLDAMALVA